MPANNLLWIVADANSGGRKARVMALVEKITYTLTIKERVALYTDSNAVFKGTGHQPVLGVDPPPENPPDTYASAYVKGAVDQNGQSDVSGVTINPDSTTTLTDIFPDEILLALIEKAQGDGKYFTNAAAVPSGCVEQQSAHHRYKKRRRRPQGHSRHGDRCQRCRLDLERRQPGHPDRAERQRRLQRPEEEALRRRVHHGKACSLTGNAEIHGMVLAKGAFDLEEDKGRQLQCGSHLQPEQAGDPERPGATRARGAS